MNITLVIMIQKVSEVHSGVILQNVTCLVKVYIQIPEVKIFKTFIKMLYSSNPRLKLQKNCIFYFSFLSDDSNLLVFFHPCCSSQNHKRNWKLPQKGTFSVNLTYELTNLKARVESLARVFFKKILRSHKKTLYTSIYYIKAKFVAYFSFFFFLVR